MKYTKYINIVIFQVVFLALVTGQSTEKSSLNNGRPAGVVPSVQMDQVENPTRVMDNYRGGSDQDNGSVVNGGEEISSWNMPIDLDMLLDMVQSESENTGGDDKAQLKKQFEQLLLENLKMKDDMNFIISNIGKCCDLSALNAGDKVGYLLQNTPNPTINNTSVSYHIPNAFTSASIRVMDMSGKLIETITLTDKGFNSVEIGSQEFSPGSYIYTLIVDGKAVESKVMNVAR